MNRRILKKLSKKASPLLAHFDHRKQQFTAKRGENYHCLVLEGNRKDRRRDDPHPLKGTSMVGATLGYYEPEWDERTALEELRECVMWCDRPESMSEDEWLLAARITGVDEDIEWHSDMKDFEMDLAA